MTTTVLQVPYRRPFRWEEMLAFYAPRAIAGVEAVQEGTWRRAVRVGKATGIVEVKDDTAAAVLRTRVWLSDSEADVLDRVRQRLARIFDLDTETEQIDALLATDPLLAGDVAARPGVRIPGSWDAFETAVRAVVGQQISVAGARTIVGRIAATWGTTVSEAAEAPEANVTTIFPDPAALAEAGLEQVGVIRTRAQTIRTIAAMLCDEPDLLSAQHPTDEVVARLLAIRGIGPWTANYIALRALGDPDAFPVADLGLQRALDVEDLAATAERWRPWRGYVAIRLWTGFAPSTSAVTR